MDRGARRFTANGVNDALGGLLGRWVLGFKNFDWVIDGHKEIQKEETNYEKKIGSSEFIFNKFKRYTNYQIEKNSFKFHIFDKIEQPSSTYKGEFNFNPFKLA